MVETHVFESGAGGLSADDLNFAGSTPPVWETTSCPAEIPLGYPKIFHFPYVG